MGYETRLIFMKKSSVNGWCEVIIELEMGKIAYNEVGKLIERLTKETKKKYCKETYQILNKLHNGTNKQISHLKKKIVKFVPYFYDINGEKPIYEDKYDELLLITDLQTLKDAITLDQKKMIKEDGKGYRRFDIALAIIDQLMNKDNWIEDIKVILWGH